MDTTTILIITGDGGESYEALYAVHRFEEEGWVPVVAAPSRRRLNLVMHDFKPGWDTYIERRTGRRATVALRRGERESPARSRHRRKNCRHRRQTPHQASQALNLAVKQAQGTYCAFYDAA